MEIRRSMVFGLLLAVLCVSSVASSFAQSDMSEITGVVTDPTGGALPSVSVTLTEIKTGFTTKMTTNPDGVYYSRVLPGTYSLNAEAAGFEKFLASGLVISTGQVFRYDFKLPVGTVAQSVQVSAEAVEIQKDSSEISQVVSNEVLQNLPSMTRKTYELLEVSPTVSFANGTFGLGFSLSAYQPFMSIGGNPGWRDAIWIMDGANNNLGRVVGDGGQLPVNNPPPESINEMRVLTNNYSAEFGEGTGGVVLVTTNSGTNRLHGQVYYYGQNTAFQTKNYFSVEKAPNHYNNFGGAIGGPIRKNKTFFFVNAEAELWKQFDPEIVTVPTLLQRQGNFSQTFDPAGNLIPIYDPNSTYTNSSGQLERNAYPGNIIPTSALDPVGLKVLNLYPAPNLPGTITGADNFVGTQTTNDLTRRYEFLRIDHQINDKNKIYARVMEEYTTPNAQGPFQGTVANNYDPERDLYWVADQSFAFAWNHLISPTAFSDFRMSWAGFGFAFMALGDIPQVWNQNTAATLGLKNLGAETFPAFSFAAGAADVTNGSSGTGYYPIGATPYNQQEYKQPSSTPWTFQDTVNLVRGKHNIRVGGMYEHSAAISNAQAAVSGKFTFSANATANPTANPLYPYGTGNPLASMLVGWVASATVNNQASIDRVSWSLASFVQDDWHVKRNLTLNLGVRYEYDNAPIDAAGGYNFFNPTEINPVCNCPGVIVFARDLYAQTGKQPGWYNSIKSGVMPRLGFAWSPGGREDLVVRGGFGIFLPGSNYGDSFWGGAQAGSDILNVSLTSSAQGLTTACQLQNCIPTPPFAPFNSSYGAVPIGQVPDYNPIFLVQNRLKAYNEQFNFGVQKQFGNFLAEIGYLANLGRNLPSPLYPNEVPPQLLGPGNTQVDRPFPQFGTVTELGQGWAKSNYNAGFLQLRRNYSNGLMFTTSFTWSKMLSDYNQGPGGPYTSIYDLGATYGKGAFDVPHRFVFSTEYELPFGPQKRWLTSGVLGNVVGGWRLGSIFQARSGSTMTFAPVTDTTNSYDGGTQGVIASGAPKINSSHFNPTTEPWFDTSVFSEAAPYTFGSTYPDLVRSPGYWDLDSSITKRVAITEQRFAFEFRADFFDILNHPNFGVPNTTVGSPQFGYITSTVTPGGQRIIQLGAHVYF
jgi:hypothetical protein